MYALRKRIIVTGGAGVLGSHLSERLLENGLKETMACFREVMARRSAMRRWTTSQATAPRR